MTKITTFIRRCLISSKTFEIWSNFCGLLSIYELELVWFDFCQNNKAAEFVLIKIQSQLSFYLFFVFLTKIGPNTMKLQYKLHKKQNSKNLTIVKNEP